MEVEYQTMPNTPFYEVGQVELASSFYAFVAGTAENVQGIETNGAISGDVLVYNSATGKFEPGQSGIVSLEWENIQNKPEGENAGDILYWDGNAWQNLAKGNNGQVLGVVDGNLTWVDGGSNGNTQGMPEVSTTAVEDITAFTATAGGYVTAGGTDPVVARGVCYATTANPTILNDYTINGSGLGGFSATLSSLEHGTTYYLRAYATSAAGTAYGEQVVFTTLTTPNLTTNLATEITHTTATSGGNINSDGGLPVTARGVCWSTSPNPSITDSHTNNDSGTGTFISNITGLSPSTTYYVRAYATNEAGTAYGNEVSFTTPNLPSNSLLDERDGNMYQTVEIGTQVWMAENLRYLPSVIGPSTGSNTAPYYYVYGYDGTNVNDAKATTNYQTYGVLYNWTAAQTACPTGWHLPTDAEWTELTDFVGGAENAGTLLKSQNGWYDNGNGTDQYGFTALPGGNRNNNGNFNNIGNNGNWWSASENDTNNAWNRNMNYNNSNVNRNNNNKEHGFSVRCVRVLKENDATGLFSWHFLYQLRKAKTGTVPFSNRYYIPNQYKS